MMKNGYWVKWQNLKRGKIVGGFSFTIWGKSLFTEHCSPKVIKKEVTSAIVIILQMIYFKYECYDFDYFSSDVQTYKTTLQKFGVFIRLQISHARRAKKISGWPKKKIFSIGFENKFRIWIWI